jgi:hypothetical protein
MPSDLMGRIALLEARISLLERRIRHNDQPRALVVNQTGSAAGPISYAVDQPGLIISDGYDSSTTIPGGCFAGSAARSACSWSSRTAPTAGKSAACAFCLTLEWILPGCGSSSTTKLRNMCLFRPRTI